MKPETTPELSRPEPQRETPREPETARSEPPSADARLIAALRQGDAGAGYRFFREYYPAVYRYLLWLTARPETAEDLAQETFVRAWRALPRFDDQGPLRAWLHRIAHREFLRYLRSRREAVSLEQVGEGGSIDPLAAPHVAEWAEALALREAIRRLPSEEGEVVVLHYLQGYGCEEIAGILQARVSTVKYRLSAARGRLQQTLGEGDLAYLNDPTGATRSWAWLPLERMHVLETRVAQENDPEERMERREFLQRAASAPAGVMVSAMEQEKETVDPRLARKMTLALKATALEAVCRTLAEETGISLIAGASVADEKVTLFCRATPLREVMRQLSRPFGYTWERTRKAGAYRYELVQDLRSQLLEEELRNRDRSAALLALQQDVERYRPYLELSPDEALARLDTATPAEKPLLKNLAGMGWAQIQLYFRLTPGEQSALRAGQEIRFSGAPRDGERPFPSDLGRGALQTLREWRVAKRDGKYLPWEVPLDDPTGLPLTAVPEAKGWASLSMLEIESGRYALRGMTGYLIPGVGSTLGADAPYYASGQSPAILQPENRKANAALSRLRALRASVALTFPGAKVSTADVIEALHRATGMLIIADSYTRLYPVESVSLGEQPLFQALNTLGERLGLQWRKEEEWLQFRTAGYYFDRLKEVPNRLLTRWQRSRREHGTLTLDDLIEIAQLTDAQLDATAVAEGVKEQWGLAEWDLAASRLRDDLRYLAGFTPEQRQMATADSGLPFVRMPLAQQQGFLARALNEELTGLDELAGAALRVDYRPRPGFEWRVPGSYWLPWIVPLEPGETGRRAFVPTVRGRTREEALAALHQVDPAIRAAVLKTAGRYHPRLADAPPPDEAQLVMSEPGLTILYVPGHTNARCLKFRQTNADLWALTAQ